MHNLTFLRDAYRNKLSGRDESVLGRTTSDVFAIYFKSSLIQGFQKSLIDYIHLYPFV